MTGRAAALATGLALIAATAAGCGEDSSASPPERATPSASGAEQTAPGPERRPAHHVASVPCPPDLGGCRSARGTIVYVERVDPDGDGDAHFVLASRESITLPGISVIDVAVDLRPHPLPGPGDELAAAGPVQTGSSGQSQIHAVAINAPR